MDEVTAQERIDQLMRVDTAALINIIRDMEHKLSEYQRQDKMPLWAQALETRLEQLEKLRQSDLMGSNNSTQNASSSVPLAGVSEDRLLARVRGEIEAAISGLHLQLDTKVSSAGLEMERLHKLLQIRPTNSDLQQVVLNIRTIETKNTEKIEQMSESVMQSLQKKLSEEMVSLLDELKNGSNKSEEHQKFLRSQMQTYNQEIAKVRSEMNGQFDSIAQDVMLLRSQMKASDEMIRRQAETHMQDMNKVNITFDELKNEIKMTQKSAEQEKRVFTQELKALEDRIHGSLDRLGTKQETTQRTLEETQTALTELDNNFSTFKIEANMEIEGLQKIVKHMDHILTEEQKKMKLMVQIVEEFNAMDFPSKLARHDEKLNKITFDLNDLTATVTNTVFGEMKNANMKINVLQEAVNVHLPALINNNAVQIQVMEQKHNTLQEGVNQLQTRIESAQDQIDSLLPLKEQAKIVSEKLAQHDSDILALQEAMTASIEAQEELAQRVTDVEEAVENLDASITERMNSMRENLLDALLEKQGEVRGEVAFIGANLEAMSMAGEMGVGNGGRAGGMSSGSGGGSGAVVGGMGGVGSMVATNVSELDMGGPGGNGGAGAGSGGMKRTLSSLSKSVAHSMSFKRPTMGGAVLTGQGASTNTGLGNGVGAKSQFNILSSFSEPYEGDNSHATNASGGAMHQFPNPTPQFSVNISQNAAMGGGVGGGGLSRQPSMASRGGGAPLSRPPSFATPAAFIPSRGPSANMMTAVNNPVAAVAAAPSMPRFTPATTLPVIPQAVNNSNVPRETAVREGGAVAAQKRRVSFSSTPQEVNANAPTSSPKQSPRQVPGARSSRSPSPARETAVSGSTDGSAGMETMVSPGANPVEVLVDPSMDTGVSAGEIVAYNPYPQQPLGSPRSAAAASELAHLLGPSTQAYVHTQEAVYVADVCMNYEMVCVSRKRVAPLPPVMLKSIVEVCMNIAEHIAHRADFEMVLGQLGSIGDGMVMGDAAGSVVYEVTYDEAFVVNKRTQLIEEFLQHIQSVLHSQSQFNQPGIVRYDARLIFIQLVKKAIETFMTKHNQVLVAGNSRLGRVKIPTCIACDRPLLEKVKLDAIQHPPLPSSLDDPPSPTGPQSRPRTSPLFSASLSSLDSSGGGGGSFSGLGAMGIGSRGGSRGGDAAYVMKAGFKMPKKGKGGQMPAGQIH